MTLDLIIPLACSFFSGIMLLATIIYNDNEKIPRKMVMAFLSAALFILSGIILDKIISNNIETTELYKGTVQTTYQDSIFVSSI